MMGTRVFIAVGSNEQPKQNLKAGIKLLNDILIDISVSVCYRSKSHNGGADYLNLVVSGVASNSTPEELVANLKAIEKCCGRVKNGEHRCALDLDLLLFGQYEILDLYPHPDLFTYSFVAVPFRDLLQGFTGAEFKNDFFRNILKKTEFISDANLTKVSFSYDIA